MRVPQYILNEAVSFCFGNEADGPIPCIDSAIHANGRKCRAFHRCPYDVLVESQDEVGFMVNPHLEENLSEVSNTDPSAGTVTRNRQPIVFCTTPRVLRNVGMRQAYIMSNATIVRKCTGHGKDEHGIAVSDLADIPNLVRNPVAVFRDGENFVVLTDRPALTLGGYIKPIMVYLKPSGTNGPHNFIASVYPRERGKEEAYLNWARAKGGLVFLDESRIAGIGLEDETTSQLKPQTVATLDAFYSNTQMQVSARA